MDSEIIIVHLCFDYMNWYENFKYFEIYNSNEKHVVLPLIPLASGNTYRGDKTLYLSVRSML